MSGHNSNECGKRALLDRMAKQDVQPDGMSTPLGGGGGVAGISQHGADLAYHDLRKWLEEAAKLGG
jgi:hypothetical protein